MPENKAELKEIESWDLSGKEKNQLFLDPTSSTAQATSEFFAAIAQETTGHDDSAIWTRAVSTGISTGVKGGPPLLAVGTSIYFSRQARKKARREARRQLQAQVRRVQEYLTGQRSGLRSQITQGRRAYQTAGMSLQQRIAQGLGQYSEFTGEGLTTSLAARRRGRAFEAGILGQQEQAYEDITSTISRLEGRRELLTDLTTSLEGSDSLARAKTALQQYKDFLES